MKNKVVSVFVLFAFLSTQVFAICENERAEYEDWNDKCEKLSASFQVTGVAGGIFAIVTFGASMAPCLALCAAAHNACRIKDEKKNNLTRCENFNAENDRIAAAEAQTAIEKEDARKTRINSVNDDYTNRKTQVTKAYADKLRTFVEEYVAEGWDTTSPESQEHLRHVRVNFENERNAKLDELEQERKKTVESA